MDDSEYSEGGSKIQRHERAVEFKPADSEDSSMDEIVAHVDKFVGPAQNVFHELVSEHIHVDVHVVNPSAENNFYTLYTTGMSDKPMNSPFPDLKYAELMICLPPDWNLKHESFSDERNYWPIRWLKTLARLPQVYDTWLWETHTVPNGDPAEAFAGNTDFCCMLVTPLVLFDKGLRTLRIRDDKVIHFFGLIPLYREEMDFKLKYGVDRLYGKFGEHTVSELLDLSRKNTCRKKFLGLF